MRVVAVVGLLGGMLVAGSMVSGSAEAVSANRVTITRDSSGIPHITAGNSRRSGMARRWRSLRTTSAHLPRTLSPSTARGRSTRPEWPQPQLLGGRLFTNLNSDFFWRSVKASGMLIKEMHQPPPLGPLPQVLSVYNGFVSGYNTYLKSGNSGPACAGKAWVRPIALSDMFLGATRWSSKRRAHSSYRWRQRPPRRRGPHRRPRRPLRPPPPPGFPKARMQRPSSERSGPTATSAGVERIGIGSQDSAAGDGMLLANPHFPWRGTERFWMAQLTVPGQ